MNGQTPNLYSDVGRRGKSSQRRRPSTSFLANNCHQICSRTASHVIYGRPVIGLTVPAPLMAHTGWRRALCMQ
jgi:hypothetical protein